MRRCDKQTICCAANASTTPANEWLVGLQSSQENSGATTVFRALYVVIVLMLCVGYFLLLPRAQQRRFSMDRNAEPVGTRFAESSNVKPKRVEVASFSGGCFWAMEALFRETPGVLATRVGFSGGHTEFPTYKQVGTGRTGHAETTEVRFDPDQVSYQHLLELFFENHDPTFEHRGGDWTDQCRSSIHYHTPEQQALAQAELEKRRNSGEYEKPLVTEIVPAGPFYPAEDYHQQYVEKQGIRYVCPIGKGKKRTASE
jgi:peptide-methionine (S)-S-oxide reductase